MDIIVVGPTPVVPGAIIRARPVGALIMRDEAGGDEKILAVPVDALHPFYTGVDSWRSLPAILTEQIAHFFKHYKDLEKGKSVDIIRWADPRKPPRSSASRSSATKLRGDRQVLGGLFAVVLALGVFAAGFGALIYLEHAWLERRPPSDITRLKAHMEDAARRVIRVEPDGVIGRSRSSPAYRIYRVFIRELDGQVTEHQVAVEAPLFGGYPAVRDFSHPKRTRRI
jgi:hypothetical protein